MPRSGWLPAENGGIVGRMKPFAVNKPLIGMVHLLPLPGSYRYPGGGLTPVLDAALRDLAALEAGGADGAIVENLADVPYAKLAPIETVTAMAVILQEIVRKARVPIGVNVLRNDGKASIAMAAATGASFIRVNVFCGVAFTDQGVIEGEAHTLLDLRRRLGWEIALLADVHVKHAAHPESIEHAALDAARNLPDGLVVSGIATGKRTPPENLQAVRQASTLPVLIGSGVRIDNLSVYHAADGFIVGSSLKEGGKVEAPVEEKRVRALAEGIADLRDEA